MLYSLSHFEWDGHTVHMLAQQHLPAPLTSTVKLSLFTHAHSSPLSLAARLHQCCVNRTHYINNGWTFSGETRYIYERDRHAWSGGGGTGMTEFQEQKMEEKPGKDLGRE